MFYSREVCVNVLPQPAGLADFLSIQYLNLKIHLRIDADIIHINTATPGTVISNEHKKHFTAKPALNIKGPDYSLTTANHIR